jgi:SAM-dependent methyltransferase
MNSASSALLYKMVIDPLLMPVQARVQSLITGNRSILDVACGTGALSLRVAAQAQHVVGIDISSSMITAANKTKQKRSIKNVEFFQADATRDFPFKTNEFDTALISMGLHQFTFAAGCTILQQMQRTARQVIILDYAVPLSDNWAGLIVRFFELLGGREHYLNFKLYIKNGGIKSLINKAGLIRNFEKTTNNKIFMIAQC